MHYRQLASRTQSSKGKAGSDALISRTAPRWPRQQTGAGCRLKRGSASKEVLRRHHGEQHRHRQNDVGARNQHGRARGGRLGLGARLDETERSEEHTSELQSLLRSSYAVFCLEQKSSDSDIVAYSECTKYRTCYYSTI